MKSLAFVILSPYMALAALKPVENNVEEKRINFLFEVISSNLKNNRWNHLITYGNLPDAYYNTVKRLPLTFTTTNNDDADYWLPDAVPYHTNTIIIHCFNFSDFEMSLRQVVKQPYWHPLANIFILYSEYIAESKLMAKIFFILWYYKASNAVLVLCEDNQVQIAQYNPLVVPSDNTTENFGCRTSRPISIPIQRFSEGFICESNCENVSIHSRHRHSRLGTCIGVTTHTIPYDTYDPEMNLFKDRAENMNGFVLTAMYTEGSPFLTKTLENGKYKLDARDGHIWNTLAELMHFVIEVGPDAAKIKVDDIVKGAFFVAHRKLDLLLVPLYQFDYIFVELDMTFTFKDSGLCFVSHKAPFKTTLINLNVDDNIGIAMQVLSCLLCIWLVFSLYSAMEKEKITVDLIGKNFMNAVRSALSISLHKPPSKRSFRIFLFILLWSFFIISFYTQAAIISILTAYKRGREVDTFEDVVDKGYTIQGGSTPDSILPPEDNKNFAILNSRFEPTNDVYECLMDLANDSRKFCQFDCAMGRYYLKNLLDARGQQFLHIAKDRIHSHYMTIGLYKNSYMTENMDKHLMTFFEAGLIQKWEQYRFNNIKYEALVKPLGMGQFYGIFCVYLGLTMITVFVFVLELILGIRKL